MKKEVNQDQQAEQELSADSGLRTDNRWAGGPAEDAGTDTGTGSDSGSGSNTGATIGVSAGPGADLGAGPVPDDGRDAGKGRDAASAGNGDGHVPPAPESLEGNWDVPKEETKGGWKHEVWEWVKIIVSAAVIAFVLNTFIIANSEVPSGSMENTIMTGDRVIGSRLSYLFGEPERGDIVIFHFPDDESIYYVKRVIGLPGETVDIRDGKVYINGSDTPLDEPYIREPMIPEPPMHFEVPEGEYFMMGDNRNYSQDARRWQNTYVKKKKIIAKVMFRYFPKPGLIK